MNNHKARPEVIHLYRNSFMDSGRWARFQPRAGDILVCTPYKSGTTWTQTICALLVFKTPEFPAPLAEISPWFDLRAYAFEDLLARYAAQTHRRIIKTHTPLDGLPWYEEASYLVCGRDPRDIFISMQHHRANQLRERMADLLQQHGEGLPPPPDIPADPDAAFRLWLSRGSFPWEEDGYPYWSVFHHVETFWAWRHLPNIHFLHYADLSADLSGEMRRIARLLGEEIAGDAWPGLVKAATFGEMKRHADRLAPDTDLRIWRDNAGFFHAGTSGQWRSALSVDSQAAYAEFSARRAPAEMVRWLEQGAAASGEITLR